MRESGYYPPGAEFDPRAPWNQEDEEFICPECGEYAAEDGEPVQDEDFFTCDYCNNHGEAVSLSRKRQEDYEDAMERKADEMRDRQKEGW